MPPANADQLARDIMPLPGALCAAGRGHCEHVCWRRPAAGRCRGSYRCPRQASGRGNPRPRWRARRRRGFPACLCALHQGGPGADGAGGSAAARAGRRYRRPTDRGQAQGRRLGAARSRSAALLVSASAWTLGITARVIHPGETPEGIVDALVKRLGLPAVRAATRQAMRLLGSHFVLGQTIEEALKRAGSHGEFLYSFDMLGEGARTADRCRALFQILCRCHRRDRQKCGQRGAAEAAGHFSQAVGAASALRGAVARTCAQGVGAEIARTGATGENARAQFHRRRRRGRPAGIVARCDRRGIARFFAWRIGTALALRCRPIRSAPAR